MGWKLIPSHPRESQCDTVTVSQAPNWERARAGKGADHLEAVRWGSRRSTVAGQRRKGPSSRQTETLLVFEGRAAVPGGQQAPTCPPSPNTAPDLAGMSPASAVPVKSGKETLRQSN